MPKPDPSLFQIGEAAKLLGVTRKMILNFEELDLLQPAYKDESSGFRYYSADNLTQIRSIRVLQSLGLSLSEVREYYYDMTNIEQHIKRLTDMRVLLDRNIQLLELRAAERGDMAVRRVTLPAQVCFCRRYMCEDVAMATINLRNTYVEAARTGFMSRQGRMFTLRMNEDISMLDFVFCIPVEEGYTGERRKEFAETPAICIYYRGAYEGTVTAVAALKQYAAEHGIEAAGAIRSIYLEGPPNRGANKDAYITQVAMPIRV